MHEAAIATIITAVLQGVGLALAVIGVWSLFDPGGPPWLSLFSLLLVALAHTLALRWSSASAQVTIPVLLLSPLVALAVRLLLTAPCRDLQSVLAATNRVLVFLGAAHGVSSPGVEK